MDSEVLHLLDCLIDVQDKELQSEDSWAYRDGKYHYAVDSYGSFVGVIVDEIVQEVNLSKEWVERKATMKFGLASNNYDLSSVYVQKFGEGLNGEMIHFTDFKTLEIPSRFPISADDVGRSVLHGSSKRGGTAVDSDGSILYLLVEFGVDRETKGLPITLCNLHLDCMTIKNKLFSKFTHSLADLIESKISNSPEFSKITRKDLSPGKRLALAVGKTIVVGSHIPRKNPFTSDTMTKGIRDGWKYYEKQGYKGLVVISVMRDDDVPECLRGFKTHQDIILEIKRLLSNKNQIAGCYLERPLITGRTAEKHPSQFASVLYIVYKHSGENRESALLSLPVKDEEVREKHAPAQEGAAGGKADSDVEGLADQFAARMGINNDGADVTPRGGELPGPICQDSCRQFTRMGDLRHNVIRCNGCGWLYVIPALVPSVQLPAVSTN